MGLEVAVGGEGKAARRARELSVVGRERSALFHPCLVGLVDPAYCLGDLARPVPEASPPTHPPFILNSSSATSPSSRPAIHSSSPSPCSSSSTSVMLDTDGSLDRALSPPPSVSAVLADLLLRNLGRPVPVKAVWYASWSGSPLGSGLGLSEDEAGLRPRVEKAERRAPLKWVRPLIRAGVGVGGRQR